MKLLTFLLALTLSAHIGYGQDQPTAGPKRARTPEDYTPRTLKLVSAKPSRDQIQGTDQTIIQGDIFPSRVRVTTGGCLRPIPPEKKDVLERWAQRYAGAPEHYTMPYDREMWFAENGKSYWLAVKKHSSGELAKALRMGQAVDLFLIRLGAAKSGKQWEPLLLLESFQVLR
jgi:hypothetical protein